MSQGARARVGPVFLTLAATILIGVPLLAYVWETLNRVFAGHFDGRRIAITVPVGLALIGALVVAGRTLGRLAAPPAEPHDGTAEPVVAGTLLLTAMLAIVMFAIWIIAYSYLLER